MFSYRKFKVVDIFFIAVSSYVKNAYEWELSISYASLSSLGSVFFWKKFKHMFVVDCNSASCNPFASYLVWIFFFDENGI